ncbi:hypothetical protein HHK36_024883 [Tetracentron sinense]|uniref:Uncharacterized protein n=1 Tax=Tetracentron sinense TaxID=13715 RepID=A0A835D4N7_TETSI|nr:hypothetical protein HHK36_024883 [Tetracentron sinense]
MGNCQAIDAASLVIQHPGGRVERLYGAVGANEVMKTNPGHYVALIVTPSLSPEEKLQTNPSLRFTRIKLLRPTDSLILGHAYRLITSQEVMKGLWEKKYAKMKQQQQQMESAEKQHKAREKQGSRSKTEAKRSELEKTSHQVTKHERRRQRTTSSNSAAVKSRSWRPSLQSISEAAS